MGDRAAKRKLFDGFGAVAKALASGRRMEILDVLAQGPRSVEELASEIDQSVANTSHHLRTMAGARSVPVTELSRRLKDVPKSREVIAYCRGPYCVFADDAVRTLTRKGYRAARLEEGFPEWRDAGLPVAVGAEA